MPALLSALMVGLFLLSPIAASAATATQIAVSGTGSVTVPPDQVVVNATVETYDGHSAGAAVGSNAAVYDRVVAAVTALGVARSNVTLSGYNVSYSAPPSDRPGYTVDRRFAVRTGKLDLAGKIVDAAIAAGATQIDGVSFGLGDSAAASHEALQRAVAAASADAAAIAAASHLHIVGIESISTGSVYAVQPQPALRMTAMASAPTTFETGSTTVTQTITIVFTAKP
jgi:uncharacterized protein YggE